jgi:hypothetical protein
VDCGRKADPSDINDQKSNLVSTMPAVGQSRSFGDVSSSFRVADTAARRRRSSHHVDRAAELCAPPARGRRQCRRKIPKTAPSRAQPVAPDATHRGPIFYYLTRSPNNMPVRIVDYVLARSATWLARPKRFELLTPRFVVWRRYGSRCYADMPMMSTH